ncbi:MAG: hypothetical protein DRI86_10985 [Bacteroidetes bacterium]|nr:MAG: hypothetical protein DRI86_10985 [Bacteroidota bacterium]
MKKIYFLSLSLILSLSVIGQGSTLDRHGSIAVSYTGIGYNPLVIFHSDVNSSYHSNSFNSIAYENTIVLKNSFELELGFSYSEHIITVDRTGWWGGNPGISNESFSIFSIPIGLRYNISRYFYISSGTFFNFDVQSERDTYKQQGLGFYIGIGAKYEFDSGIGVFISPYFKAHSLLLHNSYFSSMKPHLMETGVKLGLMYVF